MPLGPGRWRRVLACAGLWIAAGSVCLAQAPPADSATLTTNPDEPSSQATTKSTSAASPEDELPQNERRPSGFALLAPGVAPDQGGHGIVSFHGISTSLNNSTFDGMDNNQAFRGQERGRMRIGYAVSQEAVQEVRVSGAAGGEVRTTTRGGTERLHGSAFFFDRDSNWGAQNPFTYLTQQTSPGVYAASPVRTADSRTQWGGSAGGPLRGDALLWFLAMDGYRRNFPGVARVGNVDRFFNTSLTSTGLETLRQRMGVPLPGMAKQAFEQVLAGLATETGMVPRAASQQIFFPRLDWQANTRNHFTLEYNYMRGSTNDGVLTAPSEVYGVASFGNSATAEDWVVARWVLARNEHWSNQLAYSFGRDFESASSQPPSAFEQPFSRNVYGRAPQVSIIGSTSGIRIGTPAGLERPALPDERRTEVSEKYAWFHGQHAFSMGYKVNHVNDGINDIYNGTGTYDYSSVLDFASDVLAPSRCASVSSGVGFLPCYSYFRQTLGPAVFDFGTNDYAAFFADTWKWKPSLTLSYGVRYDFQQMPNTNSKLTNAALPRTGKTPSDGNNFGPRMGLAWDVFGTGYTVVRASYGLYYGRVNNATIFSALTNTGSANGQLSYYFRPLDAGAPVFPHVFSGVAVAPVPPDVVYFSPHFQNPQVEEAELSLEQSIGATTVTASAVASLGHEQPNFIDTNIDTSSPATITYAVSDSAKAGPLPPTYTTRFYSARLNPNYGRITQVFSESNSRYEAGMLRVSHRLQRLLYLHANYTYAHAADFNEDTATFARQSNLLDPANLKQEYAASNFDVRQRVVGAAVLRSPLHVHGWKGLLLNGYSAAPVVSLQSGLPYSMRTTGSVPSIKFVDELNRTQTLTGLGASINGSGGARRIAEVGRNTFRYPGSIHTNLRVSKTTRLGDHARLECITEVYNALNHRNVTQMNTVGYSISAASSASGLPHLRWEPTFGTARNANSGSFTSDRQVQIALRLHF